MEIYFEVLTPTGIKVVATHSYWKKIISFKHPSMKSKEDEVKLTLSSLDEIRISRKDPKVYLYYRQFELYYICVVIKVVDSNAFIVTTYKTNKIKEGEPVWRK